MSETGIAEHTFVDLLHGRVAGAMVSVVRASVRLPGQIVDVPVRSLEHPEFPLIAAPPSTMMVMFAEG